MALDYGTVRVGVALSDPLRIIARGAGVLPNGGAWIGGPAGPSS